MVLLSLMACVSTVLEAQTGWSLGAKAGMTLATQQVSDNLSTYSLKPGFQAGLWLQYRLYNSKLSVQLDAVYSQQGSSISNGGQSLSSTFSYINFPVVVKYNVTDEWNFYVGPQVGMLTCAKSDHHPITNEPFAEQDYTKAYKAMDFGLTAGAGWNSQASRFSGELRYYYGLTPVDNYTGVEETLNRVIQLTVGYRLFLF